MALENFISLHYHSKLSTPGSPFHACSSSSNISIIIEIMSFPKLPCPSSLSRYTTLSNSVSRSSVRTVKNSDLSMTSRYQDMTEVSQRDGSPNSMPVRRSVQM